MYDKMKHIPAILAVAYLLTACKGDEPAIEITPDNPLMSDLTFNIEGQKATLTDVKESCLSVIIPPTIDYNGKSIQVTQIGRSAFSNCTNLTNLTLPPDIEYIHDYAFKNTAIKNLNLTDVRPWCKVKMEKYTSTNSPIHTGTTLSINGVAVDTLVVSPPVVNINPFVFANLNCNALIIEKGIKTIGTKSFSRAQFSHIQLADGIMRIEDEAFKDCGNLTTVKFGVYTPQEREEYGLYIGNNAFQGTHIKEIQIPDYTYIQDEAFSSVENLYLGDNIYVIGSGFIEYTKNVYAQSIESYCNITFAKQLNDIIIDQNPHPSDRALFSNNKSIEDLIIPYNVKRIKPFSFACYNNIRSVHFEEGAEKIGDFAFFSCQGIKEAIFSSSVKTIGQFAFRDCTSLEKIELNEGITTIEGYVFENCSSLSSVVIPSTLVSLKGGAFRNCTGLKSAIFKNGTRYIGYKSFYNCSNLEIVALPSTLISLDEYAFGNCDKLKQVFMPCKDLPHTETHDYTIFSDSTYETGVLYVPEGCINKYKEDSQWGKFKHIEEFDFSNNYYLNK